MTEVLWNLAQWRDPLDSFFAGQEQRDKFDQRRTRRSVLESLAAMPEGQIDYQQLAGRLARGGMFDEAGKVAQVGTLGLPPGWRRTTTGMEPIQRGPADPAYIAEVKRAAAENPSEALRNVRAAGLDPQSPEGRQALFGQKLNPPLTATDRKAIYDAEDEIPTLGNVVDTLKRAKAINPHTHTGFGARQLGVIGTTDIPGTNLLINRQRAEATREWDQLMSLEAIKSMSNYLKGATTDRELFEFQRILSDASTPIEIRERTIDRMLQLAERKKTMLQDRANELRGGTFFKPREQIQQPAAQIQQPQSQQPNVIEGTIIRNPQTGQRLILRNGQWEPVQ